MHNPAPILKNDTHKLLWDFDIHTDHLISTRRPDLIIINENLQNCRLCCPGKNLKECEKKDKYLDLARELEKLWNMKVIIVPIVIDAFGTITKGFGGRVETIQMRALPRTAVILRRVQET